MGTRWLCIILFLAFCRSFRRTFFAKGDRYASIAEMEQIVNLEMELGESLEKFVELEKKRLQQIKQFAESVKEATNQVKIEGLKSLESPTTTYALIKRFANGWSEIGKFLEKDYSNGKYRYDRQRLNFFNYTLLGFSYFWKLFVVIYGFSVLQFITIAKWLSVSFSFRTYQSYKF